MSPKNDPDGPWRRLVDRADPAEFRRLAGWIEAEHADSTQMLDFAAFIRRYAEKIDAGLGSASQPKRGAA